MSHWLCIGSMHCTLLGLQAYVDRRFAITCYRNDCLCVLSLLLVLRCVLYDAVRLFVGVLVSMYQVDVSLVQCAPPPPHHGKLTHLWSRWSNQCGPINKYGFVLCSSNTAFGKILVLYRACCVWHSSRAQSLRNSIFRRKYRSIIGSICLQNIYLPQLLSILERIVQSECVQLHTLC